MRLFQNSDHRFVCNYFKLYMATLATSSALQSKKASMKPILLFYAHVRGYPPWHQSPRLHPRKHIMCIPLISITPSTIPRRVLWSQKMPTFWLKRTSSVMMKNYIYLPCANTSHFPVDEHNLCHWRSLNPHDKTQPEWRINATIPQLSELSQTKSPVRKHDIYKLRNRCQALILQRYNAIVPTPLQGSYTPTVQGRISVALVHC